MGDTTGDPDAAARGLEESADGRGDGSTGAVSLGSHSSRVVEKMDRVVGRMLQVQPRPADATVRRRPFETPLLMVGVRCTVRYIVLPFALPLVGVATGATRGIVTGAALGILLILDVIAVISIVATLRWLWRHQHPRRWQYLPVALALTALVAFFLVNDTRVLYA